MIKSSPENEHRRNLSQHNEGHIKQTHSKHHSQWWKTESISSKVRNKTKMSAVTTIIQPNFWSPSHGNQGKKRSWKRSKAVTVCRWHNTIYIQNPKDATRKLQELINEFGKVAGYKINALKSPAFLYTNNKQDQKKIMETLPSAITTKRMKYLGINLSKEAKNLCSEN